MSELNATEIINQLTITKEVLQKGGYYEEEQDFKVRTTDFYYLKLLNILRKKKGVGFL